MHTQVLDFWFKELEPKQWWEKNHQLDLMIQTKFGALHQQAKAGELFEWRETPSGSLAEVIVLDQFSRNIFRDRPESFASDPLALALAQFAISKGFDLELSPTERSFLYLPFMHSESKVIHQQAIKLFEALGNANSLEFERKHKVIIDRFGRYPHRNSILGRESTDEEIEFLKEPDSSF
ncbi:MAG: DUF924 domain-containing protein [Oceanospirillales bacterium]|nr:MAG: DUF924 domain-containing protein [Oceanospirillales bacterium]